MNKATFPYLLDKHFKLNDLKEICFQLGIDYENLAGEIKKEKIRELIQYCQRINRLDDLRNISSQLRPTLRESFLTAAVPVRTPLPIEKGVHWLRKPLFLSFSGFLLAAIAYFFVIKGVSQPPEENKEFDTRGSFSPSLSTSDGRTTDMVFVEAGSFMMGYDEGKDHHQPAHSVYLDGYWIDTYEVTNQEYQAFVDDPIRTQEAPDFWENGRYRGGLDDHPVVGVSWHDAAAFCEWDGLKRLPTEAEWEKAARGDDGRLWPWGNEWDNARANVLESGYENTWPVGSNPDGNSPYGAADMAGNVWEWVSDWYESDFYASNQNRNPTGPPEFLTTNKVMRGGSWTDAPSLTQTFVRLGVFPPTYTAEQVGFRCACDDCNSFS